jgi:hypothetical protein
MQLRKKSDSALISLTNSVLEPPNSGKALPQNKWQSLAKVTLGALYLLLIVALPAMASCGDLSRDLLASSLFTLPAVSSVSAFGLPLLAIVSIESFILHQRESIPYLKAFGLAALANGFYLVASPVSYAFFTLSPLSLLGSVISASMCLSFCQRTGYLKHLSKGMFTFLVYLLFVGLGFVHLFLMTSMNSSASPAFLYAVTAGLLLIGFIFGFVAKGFAIALGLREKRPSLATTVMSMHVGSFAIIPLAFYIMPPQWWQ